MGVLTMLPSRRLRDGVCHLRRSAAFKCCGSFERMIEERAFDFEGNFDICPFQWYGAMRFPGYSVCIMPKIHHAIRLVKKG
jgi:hypothetical protein